MFKKIMSALLCVMLIASSIVLVSAADSSKASSGVDTEYTTAAEAIDAEYAYDGDLGAFYTPESTTFKTWAPTATAVKLNRYATGSDNEPDAQNLGTVDMEKLMDGDNWTGVWSTTVTGDIANTYYTYSVTAPKSIKGGDEQTVETEDVYSVATGVNGKRSMVCDLESTNPEGWEKDKNVLLDDVTQSYVWEVHVKDFSYNPNSGVSAENRGKYLAFTETGTTLNGEGNVSTCIDYLKQLGVTTVQINPFYDFGSVNEGGSDTQFNWGYDPMNYNVPEGSYSSNPYDGNVRIKECKAMIKALHDAGISVVMDVVYNHTYVTDTCFNRTVPEYYYRMNANGTYSNASGCGNDTASERAMFRKYMIDSCRYWVDQYHVDGFRFDLMGLHDVETMNLIRENLDEVDPRISIWGEGWSMGSNFPKKTCTGSNLVPATQANSGSINDRIGFFSDEIRDALKGSVFQKTAKGWLQGSGSAAKTINENVRANPSNTAAPLPSKVVQYSSCHDNQTLWDRLADSQGVTDFRARNNTLVAQTKLNAAYLMTAQGITFTLAGEEFGRSKDNDENSYSSSATENMLDWSLVESNADITSYYAGLRKLRENFSPFTENARTAFCKLGYINPVYQKVGVADVLRTSDGTTALWTNKTDGEWKNVLVLLNNQNKEVEYTLDNDNTNWVIIANDQQAGVKKLAEVNDNKFTVAPMSAIIAVDKESFESVAVTNNRGAVKVKAVDNITGKTIDSYTVTGEIGTKYSIAQPQTIGLEYALDSIVGEQVGTFAEEDQAVDMNFGYFVPDSIKDVDLNGDSKTNINDATVLQLDISGKKYLDPKYADKADVTGDGIANINDVTMIQRYVAQMSVGLGTVTVNYYKTGTDESIIPSEKYTGRVGSSFTSEARTALGYQLNEEQLPENAKVNYVYGNVDINYYYDYVSSEVNLHVKHSSGEGYDPTLWIWGQRNGNDTGNYCDNKSWAGDTLTVKEDGWYNKTFTVTSTDTAYNLIVSNNGSPQSADCKGFIYNEMWIVIDDTKDGVNLNCYNVNPDTNPGAEPVFVG